MAMSPKPIRVRFYLTIPHLLTSQIQIFIILLTIIIHLLKRKWKPTKITHKMFYWFQMFVQLNQQNILMNWRREDWLIQLTSPFHNQVYNLKFLLIKLIQAFNLLKLHSNISQLFRKRTHHHILPQDNLNSLMQLL